jgi:hypothetical protein
MKFKSALVGSAMALATGLAGTAAFVQPASASTAIVDKPAPASRVAIIMKNSCGSDRTMTVHFGFNGHGDVDYLNPCDYTELSFVGSVWQPRNTKLYFNGVLVRGKADHGRWYNIYVHRPYLNAKLHA